VRLRIGSIWKRYTVDYYNGVPRSTLTKLVNWFRRHYRVARLRGFDHAMREDAPSDSLPPPLTLYNQLRQRWNPSTSRLMDLPTMMRAGPTLDPTRATVLDRRQVNRRPSVCDTTFDKFVELIPSGFGIGIRRNGRAVVLVHPGHPSPMLSFASHQLSERLGSGTLGKPCCRP
jgi:hypothetical protein